ncbi:unnamed protein product, partial [Mesorhabditis belari]|uniref:Uncharacterized protein n=1 Tax=Mesorhabditis belari TaxID=2138241 RepID=A0AAF3J7N7_9BILA
MKTHSQRLKIWETVSGCLLYTLHAHNAPLTCLAIDEKANMLYSSCEEGIVCWWQLSNGELVRSTEDPFGYAVELAMTKENLLGLGADRQLSVWNRESGQLITRMALETNLAESPLLERRFIVSLSDQIVVTAQGNMVSFWDLGYKALIKEVAIGAIDGLSAAPDRSVFVISANNIYKISVPVVRLK